MSPTRLSVVRDDAKAERIERARALVPVLAARSAQTERERRG